MCLLNWMLYKVGDKEVPLTLYYGLKWKNMNKGIDLIEKQHLVPNLEVFCPPSQLNTPISPRFTFDFYTIVMAWFGIS